MSLGNAGVRRGAFLSCHVQIKRSFICKAVGRHVLPPPSGITVPALALVGIIPLGVMAFHPLFITRELDMSVYEDALKSPELQETVRKARWRLVPFIVFMYFIAFLDRTNIGFAKDFYQLDTGLSDAAFAMGAGVFFIGYALFEIPSNLLMNKYGARFWLFRIMFTWGLISAGFAFAYNETIFLTLRFLLGIAEAGFFPGIIYYLTFWFPSRYRVQILGLFYFGNPLASVIGGPLSGALLEYTHGIGGLQGWQWMFLIEGLLATVVSFFCLSYLQDSPRDPRCHWLTQSQKDILSTTLEGETRGKTSHDILGSLLNPKVLYLCLIYVGICSGVYGMLFFMPTQIAALLGEKVGLKVGLVTAIPWTFAVIGLAIVPRLSDKTGDRRFLPAGCMLFGALCLLGSGFAPTPFLSIVCLCAAAFGFLSANATFWGLPTMYLSGVAAASGIALINSVGNLGGFTAPNLRVWAEHAFSSSAAGVTALGILSIIAAIMWLCMKLPKGQ